ncbi:hypothetical protein GN956_G21904 [Arapaima gigas]
MSSKARERFFTGDRSLPFIFARPSSTRGYGLGICKKKMNDLLGVPELGNWRNVDGKPWRVALDGSGSGELTPSDHSYAWFLEAVYMLKAADTSY